MIATTIASITHCVNQALHQSTIAAAIASGIAPTIATEEQPNIQHCVAQNVSLKST